MTDYSTYDMISKDIPSRWWVNPDDKPRVTELTQTDDTRRFMLRWHNITRLFWITSCQQSVSPNSSRTEIEYQIKRLMKQIEIERAIV